MKRVLIIGGNGFVGGRLYEAGMRAGYELAIADLSITCTLPSAVYFPCDISSEASVSELFSTFRPTLVINVAAIADIDLAQREQALAHRVNVVGAGNCAHFAQEIGAKYFWFSSDAVFDGSQSFYTEISPTCPINYYGESKRLGEAAVLQANPQAIILRLSLILGVPIQQGNSFLAAALKKMRQGESLLCPVEEIRTPIDVYTLCEAIYELDNLDFSGILHLGARNSVSRYEMTCGIALLAGVDPALAIPLNDPAPEKAPRHRNGILSIEKAASLLRSTHLLSWEESIQRALSTSPERHL